MGAVDGKHGALCDDTGPSGANATISGMAPPQLPGRRSMTRSRCARS